MGFDSCLDLHLKLKVFTFLLQAKPTSGNFRILVCAASNAAVDEIVFRLKNDPPFLNGNNNNAGKIGRSLSNPGRE